MVSWALDNTSYYFTRKRILSAVLWITRVIYLQENGYYPRFFDYYNLTRELEDRVLLNIIKFYSIKCYPYFRWKHYEI